MEYFWAVLVLIGLSFSVTVLLTGILGSYVIILYTFFGFVLGADYIIIGIGGVIGNMISIVQANRYIKNQGTFSQAPNNSRFSSFAFIISFILTLVVTKVFNYDIPDFNYWYYLPIVLILWFIIRLFIAKNNNTKLSSFKHSVIKYKIIDKYDSDPKWATYLYFDNGDEGWNQTIPGSFLAKNPETDLTFVHNTKEDAIRYAKNSFENAELFEII